jgi:hypothetical protein|tara:strand:+ start:6447 stop:6671 length:225 start_codon:yes stop_codon:yes gene_type:complete
LGFDKKTVSTIHWKYVDTFHHTHLKPLFLTVCGPRVDLGSFVIEGVDIANMLKAITSLFTGKNVVDGLSHFPLD